VAETATSGAGEDAGAAADAAAGGVAGAADAADGVAGAADATGEFARAATAGGFFLRCFFPAAGAARNSTKTGFGANLGEFASWRTEMVCG
jgi:hypothetical protein